MGTSTPVPGQVGALGPLSRSLLFACNSKREETSIRTRGASNPFAPLPKRKRGGWSGSGAVDAQTARGRPIQAGTPMTEQNSQENQENM